VKWVGKAGSAQAGQLGLLNLSPEKSFWDFPLPSPAMDNSMLNTRERRANPRLKCGNSAEVYPLGQTIPIRSRTSDLSIGGCFLEMPNPLPAGSQIKLALWVKEFKLWVNGQVVTSTPGFGIGVKFTEIAERDRDQLKQFLESMVRIRI
jgi:c-di-GMP-binding flagellar brake protein YcgR